MHLLTNVRTWKNHVKARRRGLRCDRPSQTHALLPTIARPQMNGQNWVTLSWKRRAQIGCEFSHKSLPSGYSWKVLSASDQFHAEFGLSPDMTFRWNITTGNLCKHVCISRKHLKGDCTCLRDDSLGNMITLLCCLATKRGPSISRLSQFWNSDFTSCSPSELSRAGLFHYCTLTFLTFPVMRALVFF